MSKPLHDLRLVELAEAIRTGETSAEAVVDALLARAHALQTLNIFTSINADAARAAAKEADQALRLGRAVGPLHGVPIAVKDNFDTAGLPTTAGTPALRDHRPKANAVVLQALIDAGAILLGKVGMHELAFGATSNNAAFGAVRNPYDPSRVPGGSSGGSGAVVGARIVPASLGSDTGGSVRLPANFCGAAGFRPGMGRWSQRGIVPISTTRDTAGPIARSVADLSLLDSVVTGDHAEVSFRQKEIRIGVPRKGFWENIDLEYERVATSALAIMADAGVTLVEIDLSEVFTGEARFGFAIALHEFKHELTGYLRENAPSVTFDEVMQAVGSPDVRSILGAFRSGGVAVSEEDYRRAMEIDRPRLIAAYQAAFVGLDAIVCPTSPLLPPPIGDDDTTDLNGTPAPTFMTGVRNLGAITLGGFPSLSLPIGLSRSGLPVGLTFDAPAGRDRDLLGLGHEIEDLFPELPPPSLNS